MESRKMDMTVHEEKGWRGWSASVAPSPAVSAAVAESVKPSTPAVESPYPPVVAAQPSAPIPHATEMPPPEPSRMYAELAAKPPAAELPRSKSLTVELSAEKSLTVEVTKSGFPQPEKPMPTPPVPEHLPEPENERDCGYCVTVAMAYVPVQQWRRVLPAEDALNHGTIFEELVLPFEGKGGVRND